MLRTLDARLVAIVLSLIAFIAVAMVLVTIGPAAERVDAAELCVGVQSDDSAVCIPLP